jgi:hypothetical protein
MPDHGLGSAMILQFSGGDSFDRGAPCSKGIVIKTTWYWETSAKGRKTGAQTKT